MSHVPQECPACGLVCSPTADYCDCGFAFAFEGEFAPEPPRSSWLPPILSGLMLGALCGLLSFLTFCLCVVTFPLLSGVLAVPQYYVARHSLARTRRVARVLLAGMPGLVGGGVFVGVFVAMQLRPDAEQVAKLAVGAIVGFVVGVLVGAVIELAKGSPEP